VTDPTEAPKACDTIPKLDDLITRLVADLSAAYTAPGPNRPDQVAHIAAAIDSLANARLRLPRTVFGPQPE
jgi:hypothetical protein